MSDDDFFSDLANAIGKLRAAFLRHGLEPPTAIELGDHESGKRFQLSLPQDMIRTSFALNQRGEGNPDVIGHFMGIEIRYPAKLRGRKHGGVDYDDGIAGRQFYTLDGKRIR